MTGFVCKSACCQMIKIIAIGVVLPWGLGCAAGAVGSGAVGADMVVEAPGRNSEPFGDPGLAVNGVRGGGDGAGSADVFSLRFIRNQNDFLVMRWSARLVQNGPGADVIVAENPFVIGTSDFVFMDPAIVSVSRDGSTWVDFPHDYVAYDEKVYSADPAAWNGFAGVTPVRWNDDINEIDPFDRDAAGGDEFDLEDLPRDGAEGDAIRVEGFRFLRIRSAATEINPDSGTTYPHDPSANGPDIDGVVARYLAPDGLDLGATP